MLTKKISEDKNVGSIVSMLEHNTKELRKKIDFKKANIIVEYKSGTGIITKMLLNLMKSDAVLFSFETNANLIQELIRINDKRLVIINAKARDAFLILKNRYKIEKADYIISSKIGSS